jgi:hypothetical protein
MESNPDQQRQQAHALLDMLPPDKLNAVRSLLEVMVKPLSRARLSAGRSRRSHAGHCRGAGPCPCFAGSRRRHSA